MNSFDTKPYRDCRPRASAGRWHDHSYSSHFTSRRCGKSPFECIPFGPEPCKLRTDAYPNCFTLERRECVSICNPLRLRRTLRKQAASLLPFRLPLVIAFVGGHFYKHETDYA